MRKRMFSYMLAVIFLLSMTVLATGTTVNAASPRAVRKVTVRVDKKNLTKKTYTLEIGKSKNLKVTASPKKAVKSIRYKSSKPKVVAVSKKGKITAKKKGTAKIQITVTGKNKKKKSTWVKVKAVNPAIKTVSIRIDNRDVTGTAYSLERGGWKDLKVNVTPAKAVKSIRYASNNTQVAGVDQKGTVIARNVGTARITVTVTNKDNKETSAWVDIRVTQSRPNPTPTPTPDTEPTPVTPGDSKILVAYFSATNTTEGVAGYIADVLPADLYEIDPAIPYTTEDLNYNDSSSRSIVEMNDPAARPAIASIIENMGQYDTVFLGYPIWSGDAPRIISTFLESYDFSGKKIVPFCTSGGSGIATSVANLQNLVNGAEWLSGRRFGSNVSQSEVAEWVDGLGLDITPEPTPNPEPTPVTPGNSKILVAYFSATNTTEGVAGYIADALPADLYEIDPAIPYTAEDLNYGDSDSRTSIEMNDPNARPAIASIIKNMEQYDTVFLGYPIWWGEAPRIISTFLESYDFSGKTIVPFCTSNSSGIGSSATNLHDLTSGAEWLSGRRFGSGASQSEVVSWADSLGLNAAPDPTPEPTPTPEPETSNILIAYFSRVGNTDYPDDVDATTSASIVADETERYGTTEYLARMIQQKVGGNLHRIETKETYSADFDEVVDQNHSEMQDGTLPELKDSNLDMAGYDTVFIGYPVWATDAPRAVLSFLNEYDLSGKKVIPFCTHDGYGAGSSYRTIGNACPQAELLDGLAVRASDVVAAENTVSDWLASIGIEPSQPEPEPEPEETPIKITIGDTVLDGVIYDTALAEEIKGHFPLTVSMSAYGGREYYGGLAFTPESSGNGQLNFENGDITYCKTNNTMAIFYAQTERPDLTMEVVPIGKVTSDLSVFGTLGSRADITFSLPGEDGNEPEKNKILVAYFSATNTTERLAGFLADGLPADLYEIEPETPYTSADLNYGDSSSRTSIEMNDPDARPAITGSVEDMGQYDVVFLGYPIWWGEAPRIVSTFLESYDFSGKTIVPFCTSGSSGIGSSATRLHSLTDGAEWLSGRRFGSNASRDDMVTWVNGLDLGFMAE